MENKKINVVFIEGPTEEVTQITVTIIRAKKDEPAAAAVPPIQPARQQLTDNDGEASTAKKVNISCHPPSPIPLTSIFDLPVSTITIFMKAKEESELRRRKLNFLGYCVYEYIQRAQYRFNEHIGEELILHRAIEFCDLLGIGGFTPDTNWINQLMVAYKVTLPLRQSAVTRRPPSSTDLRDIISYCGQHTPMACNSLSGFPELAPTTSRDQRGIERPQNRTTSDEVHLRQKRKITFLEKCLYEYIQRSQAHHKARLDMDNLLSVAIGLRDLLKIDSFFPDQTWIKHIKSHYTTLSDTQRRIPFSLNFRDIVNYCCLSSQKLILSHTKLMEAKSTPTENLEPEAEDSDDCVIVEAHTELIEIKNGDENNASGSIMTLIKRGMDDKSKRSFSKKQRVNENDSVNAEVTETASPLSRGHETQYLESFKDALRQLKPLGDFALMRENYRVMGLVSQLEQIFEAGKKAEERLGSSNK